MSFYKQRNYFVVQRTTESKPKKIIGLQPISATELAFGASCFSHQVSSTSEEMSSDELVPTSSAQVAARMSSSVSEKIGFKILYYSGSWIGALPLPFFTHFLNVFHWSFNHINFTRSLSTVVSRVTSYCLLLDFLFSRANSSANSSNKRDYLKACFTFSKT